MNEYLDVIRNELGCNAIRLMSDNNEAMLRFAEMCIQEKFDKILLSPFYLDQSPERTIELTRILSEKVENLRTKSNAIELLIGNELSVTASGIIEVSNWIQRVETLSQGIEGTKWRTDLTSLIDNLLSISRETFHGKISYVSGGWEYSYVQWKKFDMICVNAYISKWQPKDEVKLYLTQLGNENLKPVYVTEFGSATYAGAGVYGGAGALSTGAYDEEEQVKYIDTYLPMINEINSATRIIDACFYWVFLDVPQTTIAKEASLINSGTKGRKKSFHRYKSYQRVGS